MDLERYSERSRGFIQSAQMLALRSNHQQFNLTNSYQHQHLNDNMSVIILMWYNSIHKSRIKYGMPKLRGHTAGWNVLESHTVVVTTLKLMKPIQVNASRHGGDGRNQWRESVLWSLLMEQRRVLHSNPVRVMSNRH